MATFLIVPLTIGGSVPLMGATATISAMSIATATATITMLVTPTVLRPSDISNLDREVATK